MELLNLTVPRDEDVCDFFADLKKKNVENAWIFLHETTVNELRMREGVKFKDLNTAWNISWKTDEGFETEITIKNFEAQAWYIVVCIEAKNIEFRWIDYIEEPDYIIRIKKAI